MNAAPKLRQINYWQYPVTPKAYYLTVSIAGVPPDKRNCRRIIGFANRPVGQALLFQQTGRNKKQTPASVEYFRINC